MKEWNEILVSKSDSMQNAIKIMHTGGWQVALVIDDNKRLVGMITDGDLRRALIKNLPLDVSVQEIMNPNPISMNRNTPNSEILSTMKKDDLKHMPLIDDNGILSGILAIEDFIKSDEFENPVLIMAGGFGKRLHPITKDIPKPMLKIANQPILEIILKRFISQGFKNFFLSVHFKPEAIRTYFGDGKKWGANIHYIHEANPLGTAGSISLMPDIDNNLPIIVTNGDLLTRVNYQHLLDFHSNHNGGISMCIKDHNVEVPYGVVEIENDSLIGIEEKPIKRFFVNAGIYCLDAEIKNLVNENEHIDMTDLIDRYIATDGKVNTFPLFENWQDIGARDEYEKAIEQNLEDLENA